MEIAGVLVTIWCMIVMKLSIEVNLCTSMIFWLPGVADIRTKVRAKLHMLKQKD
jgi:hypothetical protein